MADFSRVRATGAVGAALALSACGSAAGGDQNDLGPGGGQVGFDDGGENIDGDASTSVSNAGEAGEQSADGGDGSTEANEGGTNARDGGLTLDAGPSSGDAASMGDAAGVTCNGGRTWLASDAAGSSATPVKSYGEVDFQVPTSTQIVDLQTTLTVPAKPSASSTLFIWPGLEPLPGGANYDPIGIGVLQPVLTWGTSCAPGSPTNPTGWWISAEYVNPYTSDPMHYGCFGGNAIDPQVGDALDITMSLHGTTWTQVVLDHETGEKSTYDIDLTGQAQDWALFKIELPTQAKPSSDIVFTSTVLTFAASTPSACQPSQRGPNDYFSAPQSSADGTRCCVSRIVLRAQGVPATTMNGP